MKGFFLSLLALTIVFCANAQSLRVESNPETIENQLKANLKHIKTAKDSIPVLYDIFDVAPRKNKPKAVWQLYETARRAGDMTVTLDAARQLTGFYRTDDQFRSLIKEVKQLPASRERDETILFLKMRWLASSSKFHSEAERHNDIANVLSNVKRSTDMDDKLLDTYTVVEYLRNDTKGKMLTDALDTLFNIVNSDHFSCYALENIVCSEAANIYSDVNDYKKAVQADKKLLEIIANLEYTYHKQGRKYRDYNVSKYTSLRRMMRNYPALSAREIQDVHNQCLQLAEADPAIKRDMEQKPRYMAYYLSATGQYAEAIPYIKAQIKEEKALTNRRQLYGMLRDAAQKTGDQQTLLEALNEYNQVLEELNRTQAAEKYKELQISYDINKLNQRNTQLELEKKEAEIHATQRIMNFVIAAWILLAAAFIGLCIYWKKYNQNQKHLRTFIKNFRNERDHLKAINYLDYVEEEDQDGTPVKRGRRSTVNTQERDKNLTAADAVEILLNNLTYIASIGFSERMRDIVPVSCDHLLEDCVTEMNPYVKPGVNIVIKPLEEDITIRIDRQCAEYVLSHLLRNAVKYTRSGEIVVEPVVDVANNLVRVTLTDTGVPLQPGEEELLFENFINIDDIAVKEDSGLFLCRLITFLMDCNLKSYPQYRNGARVSFSMPIC